MNKRASGILLHITSLPSPYGIGDLGPDAYRFVDFLNKSRQRFWQILPLNPTEPVLGNSPYSSYSGFAGNRILISPDMLIEDGLLSKSYVENADFPEGRVDYTAVDIFKRHLLHMAYESFKQTTSGKEEFEVFCKDNASWLDDYSLFAALKKRFKGTEWNKWPDDIRHRDGGTLERLRIELSEVMSEEKFIQHIFFKQWGRLKVYCSRKDIRIIGDLPIYVIFDSVDVWIHPELFKLDKDMRPEFVAGVPPDYFSRTGQLWGNPVYRWSAHIESGFEWWKERVRHNLGIYDFLRLDHFRGFVACWEIPADHETAVSGHWTEAPARDFFISLLDVSPDLPLIAEDLGIITPDVEEIRDFFGFPGMKLLLFAFGDDFPLSPYLPHNYSSNCVVYTGTHDNNTARGWFEEDASFEEKERLMKYTGRNLTPDMVHRELVAIAMMSVANLAIFPMQDILGLGKEARMNTPSTSSGNWEWRLLKGQMTEALMNYLSGLTWTYNR